MKTRFYELYFWSINYSRPRNEMIRSHKCLPIFGRRILFEYKLSNLFFERILLNSTLFEYVVISYLISTLFSKNIIFLTFHIVINFFLTQKTHFRVIDASSSDLITIFNSGEVTSSKGHPGLPIPVVQRNLRAVPPNGLR